MQAAAKIVHAGGTTVSPGAEGTLCKAFRRAAERWCEDEGKRNGKKFNDYYFEDLKETPPDGKSIGESVEREKTFIASGEGEGRQISSLDDLEAKWSDTDPAFADKFAKLSDTEQGLQNDAANGLSSYDAIRLEMQNEAAGAGLDTGMGPGASNLRFPDAVLDDQVIEIKGPKDQFQEGQLEDYSRINPHKPVIEVSCQACAAPCHDAGNKCP